MRTLLMVVWATSGLSVKVTVETPNIAVTVCAALIVTVQAPLPVQAPVQLVKAEPAVGVAVKVTMVLLLNENEQDEPQLMPAGVLVTLPAPPPTLFTVRTKVGTVKLAVTVVAAFIDTTQDPAPLQAPLQPVKTEPVAAVGLRVTLVLKLNEVEQVEPQLMPVGVLVTVPVPVPDVFTVRAKDWTTKPALTVVSAFIVMTQAPVPEQPPLQPVKVEPVAGVAVNVTWVPVAYEATHAVPQLMPVELLVTVPAPAPDLLTVSVGPIGTPVPVTSLEIESPSAVKITFTLCVVRLVGVKRTVTVWVAPAVPRLNGLPDTMVNGAGTDAVPITPPRLL